MKSFNQYHTKPPSTESFEKTYETAYSHGLEAIYSLETVDVASIKTFSFVSKPEQKKVFTLEDPDPQLSLDFGSAFRDWRVVEEKKCYTVSVDCDTATVLETFIYPWMTGRGGVATREELLERLRTLAEGEKLFPFEKLHPFLIEVEEGVFCRNNREAADYLKVQECFKSYFYSSKATYPIEQLIAFVEREFAKKWREYPESFLRKIVEVSLLFKVSRMQSGELHVSML